MYLITNTSYKKRNDESITFNRTYESITDILLVTGFAIAQL